MFNHTVIKELAGGTIKEELLGRLNKMSKKYSKEALEVAFVTKQLIASLEKEEKLNGEAIRQAAILDALEKKTYFVNKLIEMGATFTKEDIKEISVINYEAAVLLERKMGMRAKL